MCESGTRQDLWQRTDTTRLDSFRSTPMTVAEMHYILKSIERVTEDDRMPPLEFVLPGGRSIIGEIYDFDDAEGVMSIQPGNVGPRWAHIPVSSILAVFELRTPMT